MPKKTPYSPKHRAVKHRKPVTAAPRKAMQTAALVTGVAAAATGVTVAGGVAIDPRSDTAGVAGLALQEQAQEQEAEAQKGQEGEATSVAQQPPADALSSRREPIVSRGDARRDADPSKRAALDTTEGPAVTRSADLTPSDPRDIARALMPEYELSTGEFGCLDALYISESNWNMYADNPTSSAYGIPQALTQTHDMPPGYFDSAEVQIRWGLQYIRDVYGTACAAWDFKQANNWY